MTSRVRASKRTSVPHQRSTCRGRRGGGIIANVVEWRRERSSARLRCQPGRRPQWRQMARAGKRAPGNARRATRREAKSTARHARAAHAPPGPGRQCVSARVRSTRDAPTGHACDATRRSRECSGKCGVPGSRTAGAEAARPDRARGGRESGAARERRREPRARPRERQTGIVFFRPDEIRRERRLARRHDSLGLVGIFF